jgi:phosphoribosylformylglycinamidine synthase
VTNCLNFGNPEDPEVAYQIAEAIEGMGDACRALDTPVVSGNVSLYNRTSGVDIDPTPVIGMVGRIDRHDHITTQDWKGAGHHLLLVGPFETATLGGSEYLRAEHDTFGGNPPSLDLELARCVNDAVLHAIRAGHVLSAHDLSMGGLAVALAESAIGGNVGACAEIPGGNRLDAMLFGECASTIILETHPAHTAQAIECCRQHGVAVRQIGTTGGKRLRVYIDGDRVLDADVSECGTAWKEAIPSMLS